MAEIIKDRSARTKANAARMKQCHEDFHTDEFKADAYYTLVTNCVCGLAETDRRKTPKTHAVCKKLFGDDAPAAPSGAWACKQP